MLPPSFRKLAFIFVALYVSTSPAVRAAELAPSDGSIDFRFGAATGLSGTVGIVGAFGESSNSGSAYLYRNLDNATGVVLENAKLVPSAGAESLYFGAAVSVSGVNGLIGAYGYLDFSGLAYFYGGLDSATGTISELAQLTATDAAVGDQFGYAVALSGTNGLVGAYGKSASQGTVYVYHDLNPETITGTVTENATLTASNGSFSDNFGISVSFEGDTGVVGAKGHDSSKGAAYVYFGLSSATGPTPITENVELTASDAANGDQFGNSVSQSGTTALAGAVGKNSFKGAAYIFRDLTPSSPATRNQDLKLTASDGADFDNFGRSVSISGSNAIVGAPYKNTQQGAVYLFRDVDTASGSVTENVKITASSAVDYQDFGISVSIDGDLFVIGAEGLGTTGRAYTGNVSSLTTMDTSGNQTIDGISFQSKGDWIVGDASAFNFLTLSAGDTADITAPGKAVYIGKQANADANFLIIEGTILANEVNIGSTDGNLNNTFRLETTAVFSSLSTIHLAPENNLSLNGDFTNINNLLTYLGSTTLQGWQSNSWVTITSGNYTNFITSDFSSGYTTVQALAAVPEPSTYLLLGLGLGAIALFRRRSGAALLSVML